MANDISKSLFIYAKNSAGDVTKVAVPSDFQVGTQTTPAFTTLLGGLSLSCVNYEASQNSQNVTIGQNVSIVSINTFAPLPINVTVTLPEFPKNGQLIIVKDAAGTAGNSQILIYDGSGATIDGQSHASISISYGSVMLFYAPTGWSAITSAINAESLNAITSLAPIDASYVVVGKNPTLTNERMLVAGSNVQITSDQNAGTVTISANVTSASPSAPPDASYIVVDSNASLTNERRLVAGNNVQITNNQTAGTVTITANAAPPDASYVVIGSHANLTNERTLVAGENVQITNNTSNGTVTISATVPAGGGGGSSPTNASGIGYTPAGTNVASNLTVQSKLREYVSVKDFGAKGDGVTDDRAAIQECIDYCYQNGKTVFIPSGIYIINPLAIITGHVGANGLRVKWGMTIVGEPGSILRRMRIQDQDIYTVTLQSTAYLNYIASPDTPEENLDQVLFRAEGDFLKDTNALWTYIHNNYRGSIMTTWDPNLMWSEGNSLAENGINGPNEDSPILRISGLTFDGNHQEQGSVDELNYALEHQHNLYLAGGQPAVNPYPPGDTIDERHRMRVIVENCVFKNAAGDACAIFAHVDVTMTNCHFWDNCRSGPAVLSHNNVVRLCNLTTGGEKFNSFPQVEANSPADGKSNNTLIISNCYFDTVKDDAFARHKQWSSGMADFGFDGKGPNKLLVTNTIFNAGFSLSLGTTSSYAQMNNCFFRQINSDWPIRVIRPGMLKFSGCEFMLPLVPETLTTPGLSGTPTANIQPYRRLFRMDGYDEPDKHECMIDFDNCTFSLDRDPLFESKSAIVSNVAIGASTSDIYVTITTTTNHGFDEIDGVNGFSTYDNSYIKLSGFTNPLNNKAYQIAAFPAANQVRVLIGQLFEDNFSFTPGNATINLIPKNDAVYFDLLTGSYVSFNGCHFGKFTTAITCGRTREAIFKNNHFNSFSVINLFSEGVSTDPPDKKILGVKFSGNTFGDNLSSFGQITLSQHAVAQASLEGKTTLWFNNQEIPARAANTRIVNPGQLKNLIVSGSRILTSNDKPNNRFQVLPGDIWKVINATQGHPTTYHASYPDVYLKTSWTVENQSIKVDTTSNRPTLTSIDKGVMYIDTSISVNGKPIWWTGTAWVDSQGNVV